MKTRKAKRDDFRIGASPYFADFRCPLHASNMKELENGWFGNPVWWCEECEKPYRLELHAMRKWNQEAVDRQIKLK